MCSRTPAKIASRAPNTGCESSSRCWSPKSRMLPVDERLLGVHLARGDGDGRLPRLFHPDVLWIGLAGAEVAAPLATWRW